MKSIFVFLSLFGLFNAECFGQNWVPNGYTLIHTQWDDDGYKIKITNNNEIVTLELDSTQLTVRKLDSNFGLIWVKYFQSSYSVGGTDEVIDDSGNIYILGSFEYQLQLDTILLSTPTSDHQMFLAKLDSNGNVLWARQS